MRTWWLISLWPGNQRGHTICNTPPWLLLDLTCGQRGLIQSISWSCQPFCRFWQKSESEDDGCRVSHAEERPILLPIPGWEWKPKDKIKLSTISMSILCSPDVTWHMGLFIGTSLCRWVGSIVNETCRLYCSWKYNPNKKN